MAAIKKGNGTGDPGAGTQAELSSFSSYPEAHSNNTGTQLFPVLSAV
jgi:hypothetical protein